MAHTENLLKGLNRESLIALVVVLNLQNDREKFMEKFCEHLSNTVDNLSNKLDQVKSSLVATKPVNDNLLNWIAPLQRTLHSQEQYSRRECFKVVNIPTSVDNKNLQSTVCNILNEIDISCAQEDLKDCHRIRGNRTIFKFSSRRKLPDVLGEKNIDGPKFDFNAGVKVYINESLYP